MPRITPATAADIDIWLAFSQALWPSEPEEDLRAGITARLAEPGRNAALIYKDRAGRPLGFAEVSLREVAEGCSSSPVGYLEAWYVVEDARLQGVGRALVKAAEAWAKAHGCTEFASDTELNNLLSRDVHARLGFEKVETLVHFRKRI